MNRKERGSIWLVEEEKVKGIQNACVRVFFKKRNAFVSSLCVAYF